MADRRKLAQGLMMMTPAMREDLAGREQDIQRGKTVELLRRAGKEMYENPIVNTAIGFTPGVGDIQAAGETMAALQRGAPWQETAGYAVGMLPFVPALRTTWHGSPHGFTKFDMSKIGTGEGAQAYGHGLYLAESPGVAKSYQFIDASIDPNSVTYGGKKLETLYNNAQRAQDIAYRMPNGPAKNAAIDKANAELGFWEDLMTSSHPKQVIENINAPDYGWETQANFVNALDLNKFKGVDMNPGNFYKVDLPDEQIAKMLDYDLPLAQQPESVKQSLLQLNDPHINEALSTSPVYNEGGDYWSYMGNTYGSKNEALRDVTPSQLISGQRGGFKSPQEASQRLYEAGIPGIQYLDQSSRGAGEGTRNYVVFSDEIPQILERNGTPLGNAVRNFEAPQAQALREAEEYGQKMLGLPPGNTPMDRAIAGGYVDPTYHGTKTDVPEFDLSYHGTATDPGDFGEALYSSANPNIAGNYAESTMRGATTEGANIMPLMTRRGNQMQVEGMKGMEPMLEKAGGIENWFDLNPQQQAQIAKDMGYTSVRDFGYPQTANYDLGDVRSKFAAFDPRYFGKPGLMLGAGGLGVYGALQGEDEYK